MSDEGTRRRPPPRVKPAGLPDADPAAAPWRAPEGARTAASTDNGAQKPEHPESGTAPFAHAEILPPLATLTAKLSAVIAGIEKPSRHARQIEKLLNLGWPNGLARTPFRTIGANGFDRVESGFDRVESGFDRAESGFDRAESGFDRAGQGSSESARQLIVTALEGRRVSAAPYRATVGPEHLKLVEVLGCRPRHLRRVTAAEVYAYLRLAETYPEHLRWLRDQNGGAVNPREFSPDVLREWLEACPPALDAPADSAASHPARGRRRELTADERRVLDELVVLLVEGENTWHVEGEMAGHPNKFQLAKQHGSIRARTLGEEKPVGAALYRLLDDAWLRRFGTPRPR